MSQKGLEKDLPPMGHRKRPLSIIEENDDDGLDTGGQETPEKQNLPANEVTLVEAVRSPSFKAIKQFFIDKAEGHKKNTSEDKSLGQKMVSEDKSLGQKMVSEDKSLGQKKVENKKKPVSESMSHNKVTKSRPSDTKSRPSDTKSRPSDTKSRPSDTKSRPSDTKSRPSDTKPVNSTPETISSKPSILTRTSRIVPKIQSVVKTATTKARESCNSPTPSKPASKPKASSLTSSSSSSSSSRDQNIKHSTSSRHVDKQGKASSTQPSLTKLDGVHKLTKKTATKHENSTKEIPSSKCEISEKGKSVDASSDDAPLAGSSNDAPLAGSSEDQNSSGIVGVNVTSSPDDYVLSSHTYDVIADGHVPLTPCAPETTSGQIDDVIKDESPTDTHKNEISKIDPESESEVITEAEDSVNNLNLPISTSSTDTFGVENSSENDQDVSSQTPEVSSNSSSHQNSLESQIQPQQTLSLQSSPGGYDTSISTIQQPTLYTEPQINKAATPEYQLSLQPSLSLSQNIAISQNSVESDSSPNCREIHGNVKTTTHQRRDSDNRLQIPLPLTLSTSPPSPSLLLKSPSSLSPAIQLHPAHHSPKFYSKFRTSPTQSRKYSIERNPVSSVTGKLAPISPQSVSPPRDISKDCSPTDDAKEFGFALDMSRLTGRPVVPGSPLLGSKYRSVRRGSYFFKRKQSTDSLNSLSENEMLENGDDVPPLSASDLNRLKETAERMHLTYRRASTVNWRQNYLDDAGLRKVAPDLNSGDATDESLTMERKQKINDALEWLRIELQDMRTQDQDLARQLLTIRQDINQLKLQRCTEENQNILDDFKSELEELQEFSNVLDLPHPIYEDNTLKHIGITRHSMGARRFSAC